MNNIKKNKYFYLIIIVLFIILLYTHSNTFLANDDLPYMFLYRTDMRVNSVIDILKNQYVDYFNISGRIIVHTVLQLILIFDKNLWIIINPIMIIFGLILIIKIIKLNNKNTNKVLSLLFGITLYLSLIKYKQIIYWVAGSVNYIWVYDLLLLIIYLYYKYGFHKNKYINMLVIFILCMLHECTMVFTIVFVVGNIIIDWYKYRKINKVYIFYIIGFLGSLVLLLSPANQNRMISDPLWNELSLIEKLLTSIPVISKSILNLTSLKTLLSYVFIAAIIVMQIKNKELFSKINNIFIIINIILIYIFNIDWLYFSLVILLFVGEAYLYLKNKQYDRLLLCLSTYAVVYFNIITPTYAAGRPNYYFYMYIIYLVLNILNTDVLSNIILKKICYAIIPLLAVIFLVNEINVYKNIGIYHKERIIEINRYIDVQQDEPLYLTEIPSRYADYHMDINLPDKDWFTYEYFVNYYKLPNDVEIIYR